MHHTKGFTLIELLIVLAIAGIIGAIALPNVLGLGTRITLDDFSKQLTRVILLARTRAISTQNRIAIVFDTQDGGNGQRIWFIRDSDNTFSLTTFKGTPIVAPPYSEENNLKSMVRATSGASTSLVNNLLPNNVQFGGSIPSLAAPFASLPSGSTCSFCGVDGWGAILFQTNGQVSFDPNGSGGGIALQSTDTAVNDAKVIVISAPSGLVRLL